MYNYITFGKQIDYLLLFVYSILFKFVFGQNYDIMTNRSLLRKSSRTVILINKITSHFPIK